MLKQTKDLKRGDVIFVPYFVPFVPIFQQVVTVVWTNKSECVRVLTKHGDTFFWCVGKKLIPVIGQSTEALQ